MKKKNDNPIPQSFIALNPTWKRLLCGLFCIQIRRTVEKLKQNRVKSYRKAVLSQKLKGAQSSERVKYTAVGCPAYDLYEKTKIF